MDQEGNSTASFGSSNNMTSTETANVAMVGQTVAGDTMSSMGESPAQSSDSALEMFPRRGSSGGVGQERSAEQSLPAPILPTIQDQDGSEDLGLSRSMLSQSLPEVQDGERSLFVTPRRSRSGSVTSTMGQLEAGIKGQTSFGKISPRSSPKGGMERKLSGRSTPASTPAESMGQNPMSNVGLGAEELLNILLAQGQQCASPGATSQGSQRALPEGEPMDVEENARRTSLEMANFPHFFPPPTLPEWSSLAAAGMYPQQATLSPIPIKPGQVISTGTAEARTLGEVISPLADVVMGNAPSHSRASPPHQTMMVSGPPSPRTTAQEKTFMDWSERNTKRPLEGAGGETRDKKAASSSSDPPIFQPLITGERQISDAKFFVKRVGQENEELGRLLGEENRIAQMAAQDHLQRSHLSDEYRQAEFQKFKQTADDLARAYQVQSDAKCQQVINDRENGMKVNLELRGELCSSAQRYEQFEADAKTQIQRLNDAANYWRAESEQEARVATRNSERSNEAMQRCMTAEHALRQNVQPNLPQNQVELRGVIGRIEQEAMQHLSLLHI